MATSNVMTTVMQGYRAPSLAQPHKARQALRDAYEGKIGPLIGFYLGFPTVPTARIVAQLGADFVWVDWEHAPCDIETMTDVVHTIQYVSEGNTMAFVRVPGHDHALIGYALDAGASVVVPQVNTVEEAEHVVSATKFGKKPKGCRSTPPARWLPGSTDMKIDESQTIWENLNSQAALIIQIESERGIKNLDAILTAVGDRVDAVWIGTVDLRASMGLEGAWGEEPVFVSAIRTYEDILRKHQMPNSGQCLDANWAATANMVFTVAASDWLALLDTRDLISKARKHLPASDKRQIVPNGNGVTEPHV